MIKVCIIQLKTIYRSENTMLLRFRIVLLLDFGVLHNFQEIL